MLKPSRANLREILLVIQHKPRNIFLATKFENKKFLCETNVKLPTQVGF